jgi:hypothetical protein
VLPPKDFNLNDLENFWDTTGKKKKDEGAAAAKKINITGTMPNLKKFNNRDINLKLTEDLKFSITRFDKVNKGLHNSNINCFMNVCL